MSDLNNLDRALTEILEESWDLFWRDILVYLLATVICVALIALSAGLLSGVAATGFACLVQRRKRGEDATAGDVLSGFAHLVPATLATVVIFVGVSVGLLLLLLPGLFLIAAWSLSFFAMAEEGLTAGGALRRSYELFKENPLFILVVLIVLGILNTIAGSLIVAPLLATPYSAIVLYLTYMKLSRGTLTLDA